MKTAPGMLLWTAVALTSLGLAGCTPKIPLPRDAILDPLRLRELVQASRKGVLSVSGEAKVELSSEEGYAPFSQVVVAERPARLHMEALSPFDAPLGILTCDGDRFQLYSLEEKVFYHGPATAQNIARLIPIPLAPADLVEVLLGGVPLLPEPSGVDWDSARGLYLLGLAEPGPGGRRQVVGVDPRDQAPVHSRLEDGDGKLIYRIEFEDFPSQGDLRLPRTLHFEMPEGEVDLTLRWKEREVNPAVPPEAWSQEPPRGARVEHLP